ncbi:MAG: hypothetical protein ACYDAL_14190 [Candidatus Dormibacteraceae bacterium]
MGSNPRKTIWHLRIHRDVIDVVAKRPDAERLAFHAVIQAILHDPFARSLGGRPAKAIPRPRVYSVPIQDNDDLYGVLTYEVYRDHPVVHLFWVRFFV